MFSATFSVQGRVAGAEFAGASGKAESIEIPILCSVNSSHALNNPSDQLFISFDTILPDPAGRDMNLKSTYLIPANNIYGRKMNTFSHGECKLIEKNLWHMCTPVDRREGWWYLQHFNSWNLLWAGQYVVNTIYLHWGIYSDVEGERKEICTRMYIAC